MDRRRTPTEFGFTTAPYIPPERPRPTWRTVLFAALLALIPIVGPGVSAVYVDRRRIPSTFEFSDAVKTAIIQVVAVALLAIAIWGIVWFIFGISFEVNPQFTGRSG